LDDDLQARLDELDGFIRSEHPDLHKRFRAGLSEAEIERLAEEVRPYHLPVDFVCVHRWHDGWELLRDDRRVDLLPDADFNPLEESVIAYRSWLDTFGSDGWHPLWFPAFGTQTGELVILQFEPGQAAGQLYSFHPEEDLRTSYDSVAALFAAALDCWRSGLFPPRDIYYLTPELRQLVARRNPASRAPDGRPLRTISRFSTSDWPAAWRDATIQP
jgi:cell wall assembly regulator SMI1